MTYTILIASLQCFIGFSIGGAVVIILELLRRRDTITQVGVNALTIGVFVIHILLIALSAYNR